LEEITIMARRCEISGKTPLTGNLVSHSERKTKRRQAPNLQSKRIWDAEAGRWVRMKLTTSSIKAISRNGLATMKKRARQKGVR
jgi:large subunit ribosomal protein L28